MSTDDSTDAGDDTTPSTDQSWEPLYALSDEQLQMLVDTVDPIGPDTPRDRLERSIKSVFDTSDGSQWDSLLNTYAEEFETFIDSKENVMLTQYVDAATGIHLDRIGDFVMVSRRRGESDQRYRARLKVQLRVLVGGGTLEDIKEASSTLLALPSSEIEIREEFDVEPARYVMVLDEGVLADAGVTAEEFVDVINTISAAGVRPVILEIGSFTHRSEENFKNDVNDIDRAYGQLDENGELIEGIGGTYSSVLQ